MPSMKRPAASKAAAASVKKAKVEQELDPLKLLCDSVIAGLCRSSETPTPALNMLTAMAEAAFASCKGDRHKYQESVVDMIGDVLSGAAAESQKSLERLKEKLEGMGEMRLQREAATQSAQAELDAKLASTRVSKFALAEDAQAFAAAKQAVSAAQAALRAASRELDREVKAKEHLLVTITDFVQPLAEGSVEACSTQSHTTSLMASLTKLGLDESMMSAIPEAIVKEPATRGTFDSSVVASLQDELDKRILASDQHMIAKEATKAEAEAKVQEAQEVFERSKEKQYRGAFAYNDSRGIQKTAEEHMRLASKDLEAVEPETRATQKELAAAENDFGDFCSGPKRDFEELRDRNALLSSTSHMPSEVAAEVDGQDEPAGKAPDAEGAVDTRTPEEEAAEETANVDAETKMQEAQA